ncbi:Peptidase C25, gingipain [Thermoplasmatales archaeon SCGC AB-539-N05]|nr:Peptidase C25, gingipain [Thermoplasmatales archaeon SCGC AB-539-N05]
MYANGIKNVLVVITLLLFVGLTVIPGINSGTNCIITGKNVIDNESVFLSNLKTYEFTQEFSLPEINDEGNYLSIHVKESNSVIAAPGEPVLPVYVKVLTFPFGTEIKEVTYTSSNVQEKLLSKEIMSAPEPMPVTHSTAKNVVAECMKNNEFCSTGVIYPETRLKYRCGAGLDNDNHVVSLTVCYYPVLYSPQKRTIHYTPSVQIKVAYKPSQTSSTLANEYDLVVIAPSEFSEALQLLINHKNEYGMNATLKTTEDIYIEYQGRDEAERIKYFVKDALENLGVVYVLLVGSIYKLPMRVSYVSLWHWNNEIITDLYYADIYDANGSFCTWDSNNNDKFGETGEDQVDLYPDVHIGRLACDTCEEVHIVVDKIIHYETETYGQKWFNNMIFIGGNTFRWNLGNEGEEINEIVMDIMSDFEPSSVIWTSKRNFNRQTISNAINQGAGFLDYSGHGFEHGMGTYPPYGSNLKCYLTPYINDLTNGYKLPIIFFDACLTAKLDFILDDLLSYKGYKIFRILTLLPGIDEDMSLPCYAWYFVKHEGGGAIATIGATRTAYGGVESGAGKISIEFFEAYKSSKTLGQMMTKAQNAYISDVSDDAFTVEEFTLLGDPSLKIGGYPKYC